MKLTIIVPVFNEEKTVGGILKILIKLKLAHNLSKEIIVVNDGSEDKTGIVLNKVRQPYIRVYNHEKNRGKGMAIRTGISKGSGDIYIIQDADLEYDPNDFNRLVEPIIDGEADVVYGSRFINYPLRLWGSNKTPLPLHWVANKCLSLLTTILYGKRLTDMETCYKLFNGDLIKKLNLKSNRFEIEPEITAKVLKRGVKIVELPIKVHPRGYQEGKKIGWVDGFIAVWTLLRYRFKD